MKPRVWTKRDPNTPRDAVYIGRPSKWGNPFALERETDRAAVVERYRLWLAHERPDLLVVAARELRGKHLVCWCAPRACHGDVLIEVANA